MLAISATLLGVLADTRRGRTVRVLSAALPVGAVAACLAAVAFAGALHYQVRPLTILVATIAVARFLVTRYEPV